MPHYIVGDRHHEGDSEKNATVLREEHSQEFTLNYLVKGQDGTWAWSLSERGGGIPFGGDTFRAARACAPRTLLVHAVQGALKEAPFEPGDYVSGIGAGSGAERVGEFVRHEQGGVESKIECEDYGHRWVKTDSLVHRARRADVVEPEVTTRARVLDEAKRITATDRNSSYGEPEDNFARIAAFWNVFLQDKLKPGVELSAGDTAALVILVKMAREMNAPTEDNKVDIAGYAACWAEVDKKRLDSVQNL